MSFTHPCLFLLIFYVSFSLSLASPPPPLHPCSFQPQTCGSLPIAYPFYLPNTSNCTPGPPDFQLSCNNSQAFLRLNSTTYQVLRLYSGGITINPLFSQNCSSPNLLSFNLSNTRFTLSSFNILQLQKCATCPGNLSCNIPTPNINSVACNSSLQSCCENLNDSQPNWYNNASIEAFTGGYLNLANFTTKLQCSVFTSWAYTSSNDSLTNYEYGLRLNWSLPGGCFPSNLCSQNATCKSALEGYFCECEAGYTGDGYLAGAGCKPAVASPQITPNCSQESAAGCNSVVSAPPSSGVGILWTTIITAGIISISTIVAALVVACAVMRSRSAASALLQSRNSDSRCLADLLTPGQSETFSFRQLEKATKGFDASGMLGNGACGTVYAGILEDNRRVAVKRIHYMSFHGLQQIANEVNVLSSVQHRNLVRLLGCCIEGGDPLLVFEFVSNGTLAEHLQGERGHGLDWFTRLAIAAETADALAYLHSMDPPIFHRDVKSRNILLDDDFNTKVADFGLSRMGLSLSEGSHVSTAPQGTPGYLDPEYHQNFHLSDKSDVYSFGVVLMEIITALKPVDFSRDKKQVNLAALAVAKIGNGTVDDIIDKFLQADKRPIIRAMVQRVAELAFRCLAFDKDARPSMAEVLEELLLIRGSATPMIAHQQFSPRILLHDNHDASSVIPPALSTTRESNSSETDRLLRPKPPSVAKTCTWKKIDGEGDAPISDVGSSVP